MAASRARLNLRKPCVDLWRAAAACRHQQQLGARVVVVAHVGAALVPHKSGLVGETPGLHDLEGVGQQWEGCPQEQHAVRRGHVLHIHGANLGQRHRRVLGRCSAVAVTGKAGTLVAVLPGRIRVDHAVLAGGKLGHAIRQGLAQHGPHGGDWLFACVHARDDPLLLFVGSLGNLRGLRHGNAALLDGLDKFRGALGANVGRVSNGPLCHVQ